ncbi:MAG TPA: PhnD/SsuA/transferrin family substrate-binding protein [Minicystis sp.]|nr:PhnD/SsuA/transferrin family substrate-binding protein [Minicystis sp.]
MAESGAFVRLRIGVADDGDEDARRADLEALCEALAAELGLVVTGQTFGHYAELLDAMHAGAVDVAWLPPVVALRAAARGRTLPIALPVRGGASSFHGALFARRSFGPSSAKELRAARVAWVDRQSAAGYLVIRAGLRADGVDLARAFGDEAFLGSHDAVVGAVLAGAVDVGATFAYVDGARGPVRRAAWGKADVKVLALAGPIPADVIAASIRVPVALIRRVQRALAEAEPVRRAAGSLFGADGFIDARPEHLDALQKLLAHLADEPRPTSIPPPR